MTTRIEGAHYVGELNNFTQLPGFSHLDAGMICGPCSLLGRECRHFTDALRERVTYDDIPGMHAEFARTLGASAILDGSKYVAWLRRAVEQRNADPAKRTPINVILTARNPIAFAISHRNRTGEPLWQGAGIWRNTYVDALRTVNQHGLAHMVVRYEAYMARPERHLERLAAFLHLPLRDERDNGRIHDAGGNWSSFVPYVGKEQLNAHIEGLTGPARAEAEKFVEMARPYWNNEKPKADTRWHRSLNAGEAKRDPGHAGAGRHRQSRRLQRRRTRSPGHQAEGGSATAAPGASGEEASLIPAPAGARFTSSRVTDGDRPHTSPVLQMSRISGLDASSDRR